MELPKLIWMFCLIILAVVSQKLVIDPDGVYHYDDYQGDNSFRRKICLVGNPKLRLCAKNKYPILATKNKARQFVGDHAIFFIWPYPRRQNAPTPIAALDSSFDLEFWMQRRVWKLTHGWSDEPNKLQYKNKINGTEKVQDDIYNDDYDMYYDDNNIDRMTELAKKRREDFDDDFYSFFMHGRKEKLAENLTRRSKRKASMLIPMNVSGCVPENNSFCNKNDIRTYDNYLNKKRQYRNRQTNFNLCLHDEKSLQFEKLYFAMDFSKYVLSSTQDVELINNLVAKKLVQLIGENCPVNFKNMKIHFYDTEEDERSKVQALVHVNVNKIEKSEKDAIYF